MPDGVVIRLDVADLTRQMKGFESRVQKRIGRKALSAGAGVFRELAKQKAPYLKEITRNRTPGRLRANIIRTGLRGTPTTVQYAVLVRTAKRVKVSKRAAFKGKGDPFYWYFLERGWHPTGPHGQTGRAARRLVRSRASSRRGYQFPFLQPAFDSGKTLALQKVLSVMDTEIALENTRVR